MTRILLRSLSLCCALVCIACSGRDGTLTGTPSSNGPSAISIAGGNEQTATVGTTLSQPLVAKVTDASGKPVGGVEVTWQVTNAAGGTLTPASVQTDASGEARVQWTLRTPAGLNTATASVGGLSPVAFSATGTPGPAGSVFTIPEVSSLDIGKTQLVSAAALDGYRNPISNRAFQWSSAQPGVASVDANGLVTALAPGTARIVATLDGKSDTTTITVLPPPLLTFVSLGAASRHTCGLTTSGAAYCWGSNTDGRLGSPFIGESCVYPSGCSTAPVEVMPGITFASLSIGEYGGCGITPGRSLYCWGAVVPGDTRVSPRHIVDGVQSVSVGSALCYVTTDGRVTCTGDNTYGQLGLGTSGSGIVTGTVSGGVAFKSIVQGGSHTCGLTQEGDVYCWGADHWGQLGEAPTSELCSRVPCSTRPVKISKGLTFVSLTAGVSHTCGFIQTGAAYCWGADATGQLGNGFTMNKSTVFYPVIGYRLFRSLSAAGASEYVGHTCGVTTDGAAYCWGANWAGELGITDDLSACYTPAPGIQISCSAYPQRVEGGITFTAVAAGAYHSCGVSDRGVAYCWGSNEAGQLGDWTQTKRPTPVRVMNPR